MNWTSYVSYSIGLIVGNAIAPPGIQWGWCIVGGMALGLVHFAYEVNRRRRPT